MTKNEKIEECIILYNKLSEEDKFFFKKRFNITILNEFNNYIDSVGEHKLSIIRCFLLEVGIESGSKCNRNNCDGIIMYKKYYLTCNKCDVKEYHTNFFDFCIK